MAGPSSSTACSRSSCATRLRVMRRPRGAARGRRPALAGKPRCRSLPSPAVADEGLQLARGIGRGEVAGRDLVDDAEIFGGNIERESLVAVHVDLGVGLEDLVPLGIERPQVLVFDVAVDRSGAELAERRLL